MLFDHANWRAPEYCLTSRNPGGAGTGNARAVRGPTLNSRRGSVGADLVIQAGRDGLDAIDCKTGAIPKSPAEQLAEQHISQAPAPSESPVAIAFAAPERAPLDIPKSPAEMAGPASNEPIHSQPAQSREKSKSMEMSGPGI